MGLEVSPNTTPPIGALAPNPAHMETEETFEGWGGSNVESELDEPAPEDVIDESDEDEAEETEEETDEPADEDAEEAEDEEAEEEATEEETEEGEDVEKYEDVGKKGKDRIKQLLAEKKETAAKFAALEARVAEAEKKSSFERVAEAVEAQRAMQQQAWDFAMKQRQDEERMRNEAQKFAELKGMGYVAGDFAHELAVANMNKIDEFIAQFNPQMQSIDQDRQQLEMQRLQSQYMGELDAHLGKSIAGLEVTPELKAWLRETAVELGTAFDLTANEAVQRAFKKATAIGVQPKKPAAKPKTKPPQKVLNTVARSSNRSGRKPGKQTKGGKNQRPRDPEDEAFSEVNDGEW